jgi:hypothetical protein
VNAVALPRKVDRLVTVSAPFERVNTFPVSAALALKMKMFGSVPARENGSTLRDMGGAGGRGGGGAVGEKVDAAGASDEPPPPPPPPHPPSSATPDNKRVRRDRCIFFSPGPPIQICDFQRLRA